MAVKFFGQFLVEKGIVSREVLLRAVDLQDAVNLKFGEMALAMELVTAADVERIHDAQRGEDLMFGDMAEKLDIMTADQIKQVLTRQKNSHLYIGEALVQVGAFDTEQLQRHLEEFKVDQSPYATSKVFIPSGVPHSDIWEMSADLSGKMMSRIVNLPCRLGECRKTERIETNDIVAAMDFTGDINAQYLLSVSSAVQKKIALAILKEDSVENEPQEVLDDAVMELVNIICGNIAAKAAQRGKCTEIDPPLVFHPGPEGIGVPSGEQGIVFPIHLADAERVELAIFLKE